MKITCYENTIKCTIKTKGIRVGDIKVVVEVVNVRTCEFEVEVTNKVVIGLVNSANVVDEDKPESVHEAVCK